MNRFYQGDWIDSLPSRFVDELPNDNLKKSNLSNEENNSDFDFNQDINYESGIKSPGTANEPIVHQISIALLKK